MEVDAKQFAYVDMNCPVDAQIYRIIIQFKIYHRVGVGRRR